MGLPRTFVGFSSTDIRQYWLMLAWKAHENIGFDFADCQLSDEIRSEEEPYIKRVIRERLGMAGTYAMLIGEDTRWKYKYVKWEAEVAIEKGCRIIGINLNKKRAIDQESCPPVIRDIGAVFVPFSPKIVAHALEHYQRHHNDGNHRYTEVTYTQLGY